MLEDTNIKFIFNKDNTINHEEVLKEDFNVIKVISTKAEQDEQYEKHTNTLDHISRIQKTVSNFLNYTENQKRILYICVAISIIIFIFVFFAILIQCGISPIQCMHFCCVGMFKCTKCCFTFYCCNKKFRDQPVEYDNNAQSVQLPTSSRRQPPKRPKWYARDRFQDPDAFHSFLPLRVPFSNTPIPHKA